MFESIANEDTVRAERPAHDDVTHVRPIVRCRHAPPPLERRLTIAREFVRAHRAGLAPETLARLDAAYQATRAPLVPGESYEG